MNEKCPNCGALQVKTVDYPKTYEKMCCCCGTVVNRINKEEFVAKFECPNCGSLIGTLEENDVKIGVRCQKCDTLHIVLEKDTMINNRISKPQSIHSQSNIPTCPYCKSTNLKKITLTSRTLSFSLFGFGSSKVGKQWHCNNCKSDF